MFGRETIPRLEDILNFADSRVFGDRLYAAFCSNPGCISAKLLLEGGCGFGCSLSDEGSVLTENTVTAGYDLETTIYIFVFPERHHMPKDRNEARRCHTLLDGWQKRRHSDRSVILMELRMSNENRIGRRGSTQHICQAVDRL